MTTTCITHRSAAALVLAITLSACGSGGGRDDDDGGDTTHPQPITIEVRSSTPELVTGGDARVSLSAPADVIARLTFWLNGAEISPTMTRTETGLEGMITGLTQGPNVLQVRAGAPASAPLGSATLVNHAISGPLFTGPQQQPFICRSQEGGLGQPLVDNNSGIGHPVFDAAGQLIGHSRNCQIERRVNHFYYSGATFKPFNPATDYVTPPADLQTIPIGGVATPFVVRVETGVINRFLYSIAMLAPTPQAAQSAWNGKLVYWLRGGVGVGHQQGEAMWFDTGWDSAERQLIPRILAQGYAMLSSSGNDTSVHYNMRLAEETALMTKERFIEAHGRPKFTIALGGSGGAVQQYLIAQNRPGLFDGAVPVQSYPDMVTQTIPVSDCQPLGQYFADEVRRDASSMWARWSRHQLIEGMNASDLLPNRLLGGIGSTECINGWSTAMPTVLNPLYKNAEYDEKAAFYRYPAGAMAAVKWTHWGDLANIYGIDASGHSPDTVDNVGVQYGLGALTKGQIDADEFLRINACVGGWKQQSEFVAWDPATDPFDARNIMRSASCRDPAGTPAPRRQGDPGAIRAVLESGHVFTGRRLGIPTIDLRAYLEPVLDMHNARQSFSARARMVLAQQGAQRNQVIWMAASPTAALALAMEALTTVDTYLASGTAPAAFADRCVNALGAPIANGPTVWNGILDAAAPGACTSAFQIYSSPRMVAGESIAGLTFKCTVKPVAQALGDGTYGAASTFTLAQRQWLGKIFPTGVCDYGAR